MKILYIDPVSHKEHLNYNKMLINAILERHKILDCVFRDGYLELLGYNENLNPVYLIPNLFYKKKNALITRILYLLVLLLIRVKVSINRYDVIIFSYYEEISLYFAMYPKKLMLVNHVNISGLDSKVKMFFFRRVSKKNTQIVFEQSIKKYLVKSGISNIRVVPHGLVPPYQSKNFSADELKINISKYSYIIFSPSNASVDISFLNDLISDSQFISFLKQNNILLIIKSKNISNCPHSNIEIIDYYLSENSYQYLFLCSDAIFLPYPTIFKFRVSAVLFEAFANNKKVYLSNIDAFSEYRGFLASTDFFSNIQELMYNIELDLKIKVETPGFDSKNKYGDLIERFTPHYNDIFIRS